MGGGGGGGGGGGSAHAHEWEEEEEAGVHMLMRGERRRVRTGIRAAEVASRPWNSRPEIISGGRWIAGIIKVTNAIVLGVCTVKVTKAIVLGVCTVD